MLRDVSTYSKDFASWGFATQGTIGEFFALVIKATSVEQKTTFDKGEPYLEVHGVDMDRVPITALRMWMFEEGEIVPGNLYILRGLRVAPDRVWDDAAWKYVLAPTDGSLTAAAVPWWKTPTDGSLTAAAVPRWKTLPPSHRSRRSSSVATGSRYCRSWPQVMCVFDLCQVWYTFARCVNRLWVSNNTKFCR